MATRKNKDKSERIHRLGGADPRTGPERAMALLAAGISGDKKQNRRWDDSPATRARNLRATEKRLAAEKAKRNRTNPKKK